LTAPGGGGCWPAHQGVQGGSVVGGGVVGRPIAPANNIDNSNNCQIGRESIRK